MKNILLKFNDYFNNIRLKNISSKNNLIFSFIVDFESKLLLDYLNNSQNFNQFLYWHIPSNNSAFLAIDSLLDLNINLESHNNITSIENFLNNYKFCKNIPPESELNKTIPEVVGGFNFNNNFGYSKWKDFENKNMFVPEFIIYQQDKKTYLIFNFFYNEIEILTNNLNNFITNLSVINSYSNNIKSKINDFSESQASWIENTNKVIDNIKLKKYEKLVLSREIKFNLLNSYLDNSVVQNLVDNYSNCYIFVFKKNNSIFFGASPEKLIKYNNLIIETDSLAGSAPRGSNLDDDLLIENQLVENAKDLNEQNIVTNYLLNVLEKYCNNISYNNTPSIKKLNNIQHLYTSISAKLKEKEYIFSLINDLHPTPAVCGFPKDIAFKEISNLENFDRGLFSGLIGWSNSTSNGEYCVGIRSALMKENILTCFAGCGIVENSDPLNEYNETLLKIKPILMAFNYED